MSAKRKLIITVAGLVAAGSLAASAGQSTHTGRFTPAVAAAGGLTALPPAARVPIAETLARIDRRYAIAASNAMDPARRVTATFSRNGVAVIGRGAGSLELSLAGFGRGADLHSLTPLQPASGRGHASYRYGPLSEQFAGTPLGLEQTFTINRRPAGSIGPLTLAVAVGGNLTTRLARGTVTVARHGAALFRYDGLRITDAAGRPVRGWLQLAPGRILIRAADRDVRYPLLVDPYIRQAQLTDAVETADYAVSSAISGNTIVVGDPTGPGNATYRHGVAYVFVKPPAGWATTSKPTAILTAPPSTSTSSDAFGYAVAIQGNTIAVGASAHTTPYDGQYGPDGAAFVFTQPSTGGWKTTGAPSAMLVANHPYAENGTDFGSAIAISGTSIVVGAPSYRGLYSDMGAAMVFREPSGGWAGMLTESLDLTPTDPGSCALFGYSVGMTGSTIIVGAPALGACSGGVGKEYIFADAGTGSVAQTAELTDGTTGFNIQGAPSGSYDGFGASAAISGSTIAVGVPGLRSGDQTVVGGVDIFNHPTFGGWASTSVPDAILQPSDGASGDTFGSYVALAGARLVATAPGRRPSGASNYSGAVYVFTMPACGWVSSGAFKAELTDPSAGYGLGRSAGLSGSTFVTGSYAYTQNGVADVFGLSAGSTDPTATSASPTSGVAGQTTVAITGTNLSGATSVCLGHRPAKITYDSPTQVRAIAPNGARTGQFSVQTATGTATAPQTFKVTLSVFGLTPATGPSGTKVIISGAGFTSGSTVKFAGTPATIVSRSLPNALAAIVPASATSGPVTVTNTKAPIGTTASAAPFTVTAHLPPQISSFTPTTGITGSTVTLTGNYFTAATAVRFGSKAAKFTIVSATEIKATVPDGDTPSTITVTTPVGSATTTAKYTPTLSITSISPSSGSVGSPVTINGIGFTQGTVEFNGTPAGTASTATPTKIVVNVPAGATTGKISIIQTSAPTGTVESAATFTVT